MSLAGCGRIAKGGVQSQGWGVNAKTALRTQRVGCKRKGSSGRWGINAKSPSRKLCGSHRGAMLIELAAYAAIAVVLLVVDFPGRNVSEHNFASHDPA